MTIDEAIAHYEWAAENAIGEVANESKQMAEWLRQARDAEKYKAERNVLREQLSESRRANEHLFTEIKRYRSIFRAKPAAMNALFDENTKLRERIAELEELLPDSGRWFSAETVEAYVAENVKLRELLQRLLTEYRYMRVRPRRVYLQHEARMRAIEEELRELGIEVE